MRILGLDVGIASIGWAWIDDEAEERVRAGVWMFDPPEDKGQSGTTLKSAERRGFRGQRRVIARRAQRMARIRRLFHAAGLLPDAKADALGFPGLDPWRLRQAGLERLLSPAELAVALGHIARHRGFKSNAKGNKGANAPDDSKKMLAVIGQTSEKLARYRSPACMVLEDESFISWRDKSDKSVRRLRNRDGDYSRSLLRDDLRREVQDLFREQRRLGMPHATPDLEASFLDIAFFQRPLKSSESLVGDCPFERGEKRTARRSYSFELFRFASRLTTLTLTGGRRLTGPEITQACAHFGTTKKISYKALRQLLNLDGFEGVKAEDEGKDVVARTGEAAAGTARLRELITQHHGALAWGNLTNRPELLDRIGEILSFNEDLAEITVALAETGLDGSLSATLVAAAERGDLDVFTKPGHLSAKAVRAILPGLLAGGTYDEAAKQAGYDHTDSLERRAFDTAVPGKQALATILSEKRVSQALIGSPTARKAVIESIKQVKAILEEFGIPDAIHVELARDIGKSIEERGKIERGIEKRNKAKDVLRLRFAEEIGRPPPRRMN